MLTPALVRSQIGSPSLLVCFPHFPSSRETQHVFSSAHRFIVPAFDSSYYLWPDMIHVPDSISRIPVMLGGFLLSVCSSRQDFFFFSLWTWLASNSSDLSVSLLPSAGIKCQYGTGAAVMSSATAGTSLS